MSTPPRPGLQGLVRKLGWATLLMAWFLGTLGYGFLVHKKRLPPYQQMNAVYEALLPIYHRMRGAYESQGIDDEHGRFRRQRADSASSGGLTRVQRREIEALRAIGYLSGSTPAHGTTGVTTYDSLRAYNGLNLQTDGHKPQALLFDMQGRELHRWHFPYETAFPDSDAPSYAPGTQYWRRVKLLENGGLLAIFEGNGLIKIDRDSRLIWAYPGWAHHDLEVMDDGTIYVLTRTAEILPRLHPEKPVLHDFIVVLDQNGNELRRISVIEAIEHSEYADLFARMPKSGDVLHTNTLEVLDGSLADRLPSFREGNVLTSWPGINTIAVVDLDAEKVVWALSGAWLAQHDPTVLESGNLMLFDNLGDGGWSRVLEFDPLTQEFVWSYEGNQHLFLSPTCGANQRLPNGNTLITETDNGRAFEVTPEEEMVWEYRTPHRAGENDEFIATLFEVVRLERDSVREWLEADESGSLRDPATTSYGSTR